MIHYYRYFFVKKKVFNYSELHFSEETSFKIHTLVLKEYIERSHIKHLLQFLRYWLNHCIIWKEFLLQGFPYALI